MKQNKNMRLLLLVGFVVYGSFINADAVTDWFNQLGQNINNEIVRPIEKTFVEIDQKVIKPTEGAFVKLGESFDKRRYPVAITQQKEAAVAPVLKR